MTAAALSPTPLALLRRGSFWIVIAVLLVLISIGTVLLRGAATDSDPLDPESAAPDGTLALAEVLRDEGVSVRVTRSLDETREAASGSGTLVVHDVGALLDAETLAEAARLSDRVVLLDPDGAALEALMPGVLPAGLADEAAPVTADCAAFAGVDTISPGGTAFRIDGAGTGCFDSGDGAFQVVIAQVDGRETIAVGATRQLQNGEILARDDAAYALTLLGTGPELVWYVPGPSDVADGSVTPADLAPRWLTPVIVLALLVTIAAAVWRGRRFGPLVIENLPVTVRSSETMEGRARLYQRASARLRALDALRIGAVSRLAAQVGLQSSAPVEAVIAASASLTDRDPAHVRELLLDADPRDDRELLRLSDALAELEAAVRAASAAR